MFDWVDSEESLKDIITEVQNEAADLLERTKHTNNDPYADLPVLRISDKRKVLRIREELEDTLTRLNNWLAVHKAVLSNEVSLEDAGDLDFPEEWDFDIARTEAISALQTKLLPMIDLAQDLYARAVSVRTLVHEQS